MTKTKSTTTRRDFIKAASAVMVATTAAAAAPRADQYAVTAERLVALLEAPETPPAVRDIIKQACASLDLATAVCDEPGDCSGACFAFDCFTGDITPEAARRELPELLRKGGHCRLRFYVDDLDLYDPEGGAR